MRARETLVLGLSAVLAAGVTLWWGTRSDDVPPSPVTYGGDGRLLRTVPAPWQPPNLIVLVLDTLRADALDSGSRASNPPPSDMPFLSRWASKGTLFRQASSSAPWTMPSVGSLLTGLLPSRHGASDSRFPPSLPSAVPTFAELLSKAYGYETAAFVDTPWIGGPEALAQGFTDFHQGFCLANSPDILAPWVAGRDASRPFFLLLHSVEPHEPYGEANHPCADDAPPVEVELAPESYDEPWEVTRAFFLDRNARRVLQRQLGVGYYETIVEYTTNGFRKAPRPELAQELRAAYRAGVRFTDAGVERLFQFLESRGVLDNTLVVVTADHGEAFGEPGLLGHGRSLHDTLLRVPLVMSGLEPLRGGRVVEESVGLVDVLPTFLDLAGMPPLDGIEGRSLLPVLSGDVPGHPVLAEEIRHVENTGEAGDVFLGSARSDGWKFVLVHDVAAGTVREELYDLLLDPGETTNLARGTYGRLSLDPAFCAAIERVRDNVWGAIEARRGGGAAGPLGAAGKRPSPCFN